VLYLLRHGQTEFNVEGRIQGRLDSELTPLGLRQAEAMAERLAALAPDPRGWRLVASPQLRARRTAEAIARRLCLPVEEEPRLMEIACGDWEGQLRSEVHDGARSDQPTMDWIFSAPGGETYDDVMGRVNGWLVGLPAEAERKVIAVSHGVTGRLVRGAYASLSRADTLSQDVPQDAFHRLRDRSVVRIDC
jgi:broad specificity phosphatase PhoE